MVTEQLHCTMPLCACRYLLEEFIRPGRRCTDCIISYSDKSREAIGKRRFDDLNSQGAVGVKMLYCPGFDKATNTDNALIKVAMPHSSGELCLRAMHAYRCAPAMCPCRTHSPVVLEQGL